MTVKKIFKKKNSFPKPQLRNKKGKLAVQKITNKNGSLKFAS